MSELLGEQAPWDLEKHLAGCLAGYQTDGTYGAAVFFALEALWGIAHDVIIRADAGEFSPDQRDPQWVVSPKANFTLPWIWTNAAAR
jgi:hypothetical protein